jgi:peptidoglycan/xylan/chitin deacetylase (PgdA/CDA1 family)
MSMIRNMIKYCIAFLGVHSGAVHLWRRMHRREQNSIRIIHYHGTHPKDRKRLEHHIRYYQKKYRIISLSEAVEILRNGKIASGLTTDNESRTKPNRLMPPPKRTGRLPNEGRYLVVTFDDGYKNNFEIAAPILQKHRIPACFFVVTDFISIKAGDHQRIAFYAKNAFFASQPSENMSWADVRHLIQSGFEIGSHTHTHPHLSSLSKAQVSEELTKSKLCIEENTGQPIRHFSWPYGRAEDFDLNFRELVQKAGYVSCCSGIRGLNDQRSDLFYLHRDEVRAYWPLFMIKFFV